MATKSKFVAKKEKSKAVQQPPKKTKTAKEMGDAEAATIIQTQYRGYRVRKEYSSKLTTQGSSAYDKHTANMMRYFCRRWKAQTMFQVLLLYRAARQQDLVYFSQQVHLYNQGIVSEMNSSTHQRITIVQVREMDRFAAKKAFGSRPVNVHKIPFRFDTIPYMDTSPMCDPVTAGLDALYSDDFTMQPGDHDTWDAPLRRKKSLLRRRKNLKDQWIQTCSTGTGANNVADSSTISSHVQTPFRRELLDTSPIVSSRAPRAPKHAAPAPPKQEPRGNLVQQQSWKDKSNDNLRPAETSHRRNNDYDNNRNIDFSPEPGARPSEFRGGARPNSHIRELQTRGREISTGAAEDAPFNFQGMLRKTNYNRQSMKRTNIYTTDDDDATSRGPTSYSAAVKGPGAQGNWNGGSSRNDYQGGASNYGGASKSQGYKGGRVSVSFEEDEKRHELVPGLVVEGDVAEL